MNRETVILHFNRSRSRKVFSKGLTLGGAEIRPDDHNGYRREDISCIEIPMTRPALSEMMERLPVGATLQRIGEGTWRINYNGEVMAGTLVGALGHVVRTD